MGLHPNKLLEAAKVTPVMIIPNSELTLRKL